MKKRRGGNDGQKDFQKTEGEGPGLLCGAHRRTGRGGQLPPQFGQFVDMNSGRESTLFGQKTIHV